MDVAIEIKGFEKLQALMSALGPSNRQRLNAVGAKALEVEVRRHVSRLSAGRHASSASLGAKPSGHYRKGMRGIAGHANANGGEVVIPIAGISRAYHDIIITPNGKKYLTTPKHAAAYAHTVPELKRRGWKIFRPGSKLCLLGYRRKGDEPVMLYALAERAKQKKDPTLLPSQSYCSRIVGTAITNEVNRRLKNAS